MYGAFEDAPLTPRGSRQADRAARRLSKYPLAAVYASSYRRAIMTAEAAARTHRLPVIAEDTFVERDFGE